PDTLKGELQTPGGAPRFAALRQGTSGRTDSTLKNRSPTGAPDINRVVFVPASGVMRPRVRFVVYASSRFVVCKTRYCRVGSLVHVKALVLPAGLAPITVICRESCGSSGSVSARYSSLSVFPSPSASVLTLAVVRLGKCRRSQLSEMPS